MFGKSNFLKSKILRQESVIADGGRVFMFLHFKIREKFYCDLLS
jgi:hypothetical protein